MQREETTYQNYVNKIEADRSSLQGNRAIASSAGDSDLAIPASHFSFMSFMNSDLDQDYMYHTEIWTHENNTVWASVAHDDDLVKMEKYMGWDP